MIIDAFTDLVLFILFIAVFTIGIFAGLIMYSELKDLQESVLGPIEMIPVEQCHEWDQQYIDIYKECQAKCFEVHGVTGGITKSMLCVCGVPKTIWSVGG